MNKKGSIGFIKCDLHLNGKWGRVPKLFLKVFGYSDTELQDLSLADMVPEKHQEQISDFFSKNPSENTSPLDIETKLLTKSGKWISVNLIIVLSGSKPKKVVCYIQNLSDQRDLYEEWQDIKQQFDSLFKHNPLPLYYFDLDGNFAEVNDKLVEFTGLPREKLVGMNFEEFIAEEDLQRTKEYFQRASKGQSGQYEITVVVKDQQRKHIRVTKFPMYVKNEITGVYGIFEDITEQKKREHALEVSEQRFRSMFENNPHSVFYFDTQGMFLGANKRFEELSGYSEEELKVKTFAPFIHPDDLEKTQTHFEKALNGEIQKYEITGITRSGEERQVYITNFPYLKGNKIVGVFGICEDITAHKIAERRLKKSEQRWQQLVEHNPQPVLIIQEGKITFINQVGVKYFGASSAKELVGKSVVEFSHPDYAENFKERIRKLEKNETVGTGEYKVVLLNGETRHIETHSIPISYNGEKAIQTVLHDITDHKEKQHIVDKSLKEKETLLQEIHHRVKNNLAVISGLLELQIMHLTDQKTVNVLQDSQLRIRSMAMIHEKLYQSETLHNIGFDTYLKELVLTINSTYKSNFSNIETNFELDNILLDLDQAIPCSLLVNEVIVNCYKHAFDNDDEGVINISLKNSDSHVCLEISDNGKGLPDDFDIDEQQSLGMTLIQTLSSQLNGEMDLLNHNEEGTTFRLEFQNTDA